MSNITSTLVKDLREASGAGMMDCKKALEETKGDLEAAKDWLRTKGLAKAAKKAGRVAAEGLVAVVNNGEKAAIIELNSETDFVAKNEEFRDLVRAAAAAALTTDGSVEAVKEANTASGKSVEQSITDAIAKIGENMSLRRSKVVNANGGKIFHYIHSAQAEGLGKIGVLVVLKNGNEELGKQIAMHIAANKPESLNTSDLPAESVEREKNIFREQAKESGKPDAVIEKMIEGRIRKFFEQVVLVEQAFVMNPDKKVGEIIKEAGAEILAFTQFTLGEGIVKEETDFAAEVKAAAGGSR